MSSPHASTAGTVVRTSAALAVAMGIGRFVYTPILPLMHAEAGLSATQGSLVATANYLGYLLGALAGIALPATLRSRWVLRASLLIVIASLLLIPTTTSVPAWSAVRLISGVASSLIFMIAAGTILASGDARVVSGGFTGVGVGIMLSGLLVLCLQDVGSWRTTWLAAAVIAAPLAVLAWTLRVVSLPPAPMAEAQPRRTRGVGRWFVAVLICYTLEGVGYIIAGTFLVAAIDETGPSWLGSSAWVVAGLAAIPANAVWGQLAIRSSRPTALTAALFLQALGIALPALAAGVAPALLSALLFGGTFIGVSQLCLGVGAHLGVPRSVAILTAAFSVGQAVGPLLAAPLVDHGFRTALLVGAALVLGAAIAAVILRVGFPSRPMLAEDAAA